jgi:hypothetical protein
MGGALIGTLSNRENMVMDQSRAQLAETLSQTQRQQDENTRKQAMHPLEMQSKQLGNQGLETRNADNQFDLGVKQKLGPEHFIKEAQDKLTKGDQDKLKADGENFRTMASMLGSGEGAAPGQIRAHTIQMMKHYKMDHLIPRVEAMQDEKQIIKEIQGMAGMLNQLSRPYAVESLKQDGSNYRAELKSLTDIEKIQIKAQADKDVAAMKAKLSAGGKKVTKETLQNMYTRTLSESMTEKDPQRKAYLEAVADKLLKDMQELPAAAGAQASGIVTGPNGRPTIGQVPRVQPREPTPMPPQPAGPAGNMFPSPANAAALGKGPPQVRNQAEYDALPKGTKYIRPDGKEYTKK